MPRDSAKAADSSAPIKASRAPNSNVPMDGIPSAKSAAPMASAASAAESLSGELMHGLVVAHLQREVAIEVSLGHIDLNTIGVRAAILGKGIDVQLRLAREHIALAGQGVSSDLPLIVSNELVTGNNVRMEGQLLGAGVVSKLSGSSCGILHQLCTKSTVGVLLIQGILE